MKRFGWREALGRAPQKANVLVVEDEADVRNSLEKLVLRMGYSVRSASSAEQADQWMGGERFDACLLDIELPRMKGVEFLQWALTRDPELAVIMITGIDLPEIAVECIEQGARTYLVKPVESEFLRLALRDALAMRRLLVERNELSGT